MRRTCASTSSVRSKVSGSGVMCARIDVPARVTESSRTRASPSRMMLMPRPAFAICRMTPTVPIFRRSSGPGSSLSLSCSTSRISRSLPSARLTVSIDTPRDHRQRLQRQRKRDGAPERQDGEFGWKRWGRRVGHSGEGSDSVSAVAGH